MTSADIELRQSALALGDRLLSFVILMAELRDHSVTDGDHSEARFWQAQAIYLAGIQDEYAAALRAMGTDVAETYVRVVPDSEDGS